MRSTVAEIIDLWPSLGAFATQVGISYGAAKQMRRRGSIAVEHWPSVISCGRDHGITAEELMRLHAGTLSATARHIPHSTAAERPVAEDAA